MKLKQVADSVKDFHKAFKLPYREIPSLLKEEECALRYELMREENDEYLTACAQNDIKGVADALGDMLYILAGTIITHGMQDIIAPVFKEIHKSNMSKLDLNGKPIINGENGVLDLSRPMGKVLKPETYTAPRLHHIVSKGVINAKQAASQRVYEEIMHLKKMIDISNNEEDKENLWKQIEDLNQDLLELSITMSDVHLKPVGI